MAKLTVAIAGTTSKTLACITALYSDDRFEIAWVLTPTPKPIGRKQTITPNPVHQFATDAHIPAFLVEHKLTSDTQQMLLSAAEKQPIDILLVVDFGYFIPSWLLSLPRIAPVNIHPSALPRWRGSSPGQFVLLYGETHSAVTVMVMNEEFDGGPIITALPFTVDRTWTTQDYYSHSFSLVCNQLADILSQFAQTKTTTPQPADSPTVTAKRIAKEDAYIPWEIISAAMHGLEITDVSEVTTQLSPLLAGALRVHSSLADLIEAAVRALQPWPAVWTNLPTKAGAKRMKILTTKVEGKKLGIETVQVEGKTPSAFNQDTEK